MLDILIQKQKSRLLSRVTDLDLVGSGKFSHDLDPNGTLAMHIKLHEKGKFLQKLELLHILR